MLFAVGLSLRGILCPGYGATLFATERETETYDFLRGLPVRPLAVFAGKVAFALVSTAAVVSPGVERGAGVCPQKLPDPPTHRQIWAVFGPGGVELLAWGIFFSLLLKRPLLAVVCCGDRSVDRDRDSGQRIESLDGRGPQFPDRIRPALDRVLSDG